ncbi:hypothetical protein C8R45DRAFT_567553 [Mycena sanguinolenta]|nr:hypothetical protein C8R45DRAFT_567553 [Mycena sanguinolenta]
MMTLSRRQLGIGYSIFVFLLPPYGSYCKIVQQHHAHSHTHMHTSLLRPPPISKALPLRRTVWYLYVHERPP